MMFRKLFALGFLAILFFGVLGIAGRTSRMQTQMAWMQGYTAGQQAANGEDGAVNPVPPAYPYAMNGRFHPHHTFFPGFFTCLIPLFFLGGLFFLFGGRRRWRHGHGPWRHHGHPSGRHKPPWVDDDDLADEPVMKA